MWEGLFFALVAFSAAQLVLLWMGSLLSRFTLARLSSLGPEHPRTTITFGERLVNGLYRGVLALAAVLFHASLPLGLLLTAGAGWVIIRFLLEMNSLRALGLAFFTLVAFSLGFVSLLLAVFRPRHDDEGEYLLRAQEHPRLFEALAEVARIAQSRPVERVVLEPGAHVGVREAGSVLQVLLGRGERVLYLGMALLEGVTVSELKSILAHEHGHFSHGETRLTPLLARVSGGLADILHGMQDMGMLAFFNPAYLYFLLVQQVFVRIHAGHKRRCELLADRAAALAYGGDTFASALSQVLLRGHLFEQWAVTLCSRLRMYGRPCLNLYRDLAAASEATEVLRPALLQTLLHREPDAEDSHPPPHVRIAAVAGVPSRFPRDEASAAGLLTDFDAVARALTAPFVARVEKALEARGQEFLPPRPTSQEAEYQLCAAVVMGILAQQFALPGQPDAAARRDAALAQLEAALGEGDPAVVPAVLLASREHLRHGHVTEAVATLERARALLLAGPEGDQRTLRLLEVDELLRNVPPSAALTANPAPRARAS